jgi:sugar phosphate isomerase/epimerase
MTLAPPPLGIAHFSCIHVPPADFVRLAGQVGYAAVGLRLHPAFPGAPFYTLRPGSADMHLVKSFLGQTGVHVYDVEFVVIDQGFALRQLAPVLASAAELGAQRLSVCGDDPDRARLVDNFSALCALAAGYGMGVDLENMSWRQIASIEDAVSVVRETQAENAGVLIDALHLSRSGGTPADIRKIRPASIRSVQLCDAPAERPADNAALVAEARGGRLPPGRGALPLRELLGAVPEHAALSVEVPNAGSSPLAHARSLLSAARSLFEIREDAPATD